MITNNLQVFSKDVPLSDARKIAGVRAVFGEVYPDPVRVVCIGFDVAEVMRDVTNDKWRSTSIEFCGGTHVYKTTDIGQLFLTEVTPIAKGTRRAIAITGEEARRALALSSRLDQRLESIKKMKLLECQNDIKLFVKVNALSM